MMRKPAVAVLMLALLLCSAASAFAAPRPPVPPGPVTWYVSSSTGSDKNIGSTSSKPFRTIAKALSSAKNGESVRIAVGTYPENLSLTGFTALTIQGGWNKTFKTFDPASFPATLLGNGSAESVGFDIRDCSGIVLSALEITGYNKGVFTSNTDTSAVNLTITRCRLYANVTGIHFMNSSVDVRDNRISDSDYGVYSPPDPSTYGGIYDTIAIDISGNRIFNNSQAGLYIQGVVFDVSRRKVHNNILYGNLVENIFIRGARLDTMNNTIVGGINGVHVETSSIFMTYGGIGNNIIANVSGSAVHAGWNVNLTTSSNALFNNATNFFGNVGAVGPDILADPLLDPATFRLAAGSPCIDAGVPTFYDPWGATLIAPDADVDGQPRSAAIGGDGLYDIGADEFVQ